MVSYHEIKVNCYYDSVTLMLFSSRIQETPGVREAAAMMATDHNKALMIRAGILEQAQAEKATPNDLLVGILAENDEAVAQARSVLEQQFSSEATEQGETPRVKTLQGAVKLMPQANLAIVSVPGAYAGHEAMKAMRAGMHVLLFSDNVPVEQEIELKEYACAHNLLLMGPDCGTAILNGAALGFANAVRRGNIGLVAASGTGLQEVTALIDRMGAGVSQAIGTGGRDGSEAVGGRMLLSALDALAADPQTAVIGIISKPPHPAVMERVLLRAKKAGKPVVACFLGAVSEVTEQDGMTLTPTLEQTAALLVKLCGEGQATEGRADNKSLAQELAAHIGTGRKYVRALYTGGTLCYEAMLVMGRTVEGLHSNLSHDPQLCLQDPEVSVAHTLLDMGDDYFTNGMPHPMIEPKRRSDRILRDAADAETAVMLFDCVIGYGSHDDPAGQLATAVNEARKNGGDSIAYIASVCGTEADYQRLSEQKARLERAGIIVMPSNAPAAQLAADVVSYMK